MSFLKSFLLSFFALTALISGCAAAGAPPPAEGDPSAAASSVSEQSAASSASKEEPTMRLTIGDSVFTILPEENETASTLFAQLPLQLDMQELNGNEKYVYLPFSLPSAPVSPGEIQAGDVMLYGDNCLVVFYESFPTSYRYTRIGRIEDSASLREACGAGDVQVTLSVD